MFQFTLYQHNSRKHAFLLELSKAWFFKGARVLRTIGSDSFTGEQVNVSGAHAVTRWALRRPRRMCITATTMAGQTLFSLMISNWVERNAVWFSLRFQVSLRTKACQSKNFISNSIFRHHYSRFPLNPHFKRSKEIVQISRLHDHGIF